MHHARPAASLGVLPLLAILLAGCTTMSETYTGKDPDQVWRAMVAVAESPSHYDDWFLTENEVWADEANRRVEIYRTLKRDYVQPGARPRREERTMEFSVTLAIEEGEPEVEFKSRHLDVPAKAQAEAEVYFDDVWEILGGRGSAADAEADSADTDDTAAD